MCGEVATDVIDGICQTCLHEEFDAASSITTQSLAAQYAEFGVIENGARVFPEAHETPEATCHGCRRSFPVEHLSESVTDFGLVSLCPNCADDSQGRQWESFWTKVQREYKNVCAELDGALVAAPHERAS